MLTYLERTVTRRKIQIALGVLWLLDGALQLQHQMFTANFANNVIAPAAEGQPLFVRGPIHFGIHIFLMHPAIWNSLIALVQLSIGALILWKRTVRLGLLGSVFWGLFVWYFGEGLGGLASGHTLLLMGAPGAALLYSIISVSAWPKNHMTDNDVPAYWLVIVWAVLWLGGTALQLVNGQNTAADLSSMIAGMASGAPGWLASFDLHVSHFVGSSNGWIVPAFITLQALIGFLIFLSHRLRAFGISLGILLSLVFWAIGQSFGSYYTGLATDPNTAPLIILLGIAILGTRVTKLQLLSAENP